MYRLLLVGSALCCLLIGSAAAPASPTRRSPAPVAASTLGQAAHPPLRATARPSTRVAFTRVDLLPLGGLVLVLVGLDAGLRASARGPRSAARPAAHVARAQPTAVTH